MKSSSYSDEIEVLLSRRVESSFIACLRKASRPFRHLNKSMMAVRRLFTSSLLRPFRPTRNSLSEYCAIYVGVNYCWFINSVKLLSRAFWKPI